MICQRTGHRNRTQAKLTRASACLVVGLQLLLAGGCDFPGKPNPANRPVPPGDVLQFSALFQQNCAGCHGADGILGAAPPLGDTLFRAIVPRDELERTIAKGRPGTPMPAFAIENGGPLSPAQIQVLVYEIKGIRYKTVEKLERSGKKAAIVEDAQGAAPKWGPPESPSANAPRYLIAGDGPRLSSDAYAQIRNTTFARACAGCHEDHGQGGQKAGAINGQAFLSLSSDQVLRRLIITGRPDLKMPDFAGARGRPPGFQPLNSHEVSDLVALLGHWRQTGASSSAADKPRPDATKSSRVSKPKADRDGKSS